MTREIFIQEPFSFAGDKTAIPFPVQLTGEVSFNQGWGADYQRDQETDPLAKPIERDKTNWLMGVLTGNLRLWQTEGVPEWIDAASNGGVDFPYEIQTVVRWRASGADPFLNYVSLAANNTALPSDTTKWQLLMTNESTNVQALAGVDGTTIMSPRRVAAAIAAATPPSAPVGSILYHAKNTAPTGYIKANGAAISRTIYAPLFAVIGTTFGVGDGSTTFNLPELRGEFLRGWDDSRGIDPSRVFGSPQADASQGHNHQVIDTATSVSTGVRGDTPSTGSGQTLTPNGADRVRATVIITDGVNGTPRIASETRARNVALLACIKF